MDGCIGVKTGYTDDAGRCLVSAIEKNGMKIVCVVLNCGPMFVESAELLSECVEKYKLYDLTEMIEIPDSVSVVNGKEDTAKIGIENTNFLYPLSEDELKKLEFQYTFPQSLDAPLKGGAKIGEVNIFFENEKLLTQDICVKHNVKSRTLMQRIKMFLKNW